MLWDAGDTGSQDSPDPHTHRAYSPGETGMSWVLRGHGYEASNLMRGDGRRDWFGRYTEAIVGPIICKGPW